jgi:hypothetical protein
MGVDVRLQLFDRDACARLANALQRWEEQREAVPLLGVLREALANVRAHAPARSALKARTDEINRQVDALPRPAGPEIDALRANFVQKLAEIGQALQVAHQSGDGAAVDDAIQDHIGVWRTMFQTSEAMEPERTLLLTELDELLDDPPGPQWIEEAGLGRAIASLEDATSTVEQREEALEAVQLHMVEAHALAWDREPRADVGIGRGYLPGWLMENSEWLGSVVQRGIDSGESLELAPSTEFFRKADLTRFRDELLRLPSSPSPQLTRRLERVQRLVELALSDPRLALGLTVR